jgi:hypothetical protein
LGIEVLALAVSGSSASFLRRHHAMAVLRGF